eukprot:CAMPEP_0175808020 /NCGR_PEP_ID=MMETSP0107_2-20121207/2035_1 /TAXON_ID=195067 ORGANISM="Goniomonas pacifica, Strain CCMP1869" /NCGR_SAMPLE_ID=MMETSP0107_2 /ASSEMBLY_ACC=CAM_ASM_000203 /LENGTH=38 /DNA_ID= /DNA_START= /DNA_END= /DNA_ORIENTATION=
MCKCGKQRKRAPMDEGRLLPCKCGAEACDLDEALAQRK